MTNDAKRLLYLRNEFDAFGDVDLHEHASNTALSKGREEPLDEDYLCAVRFAIDRVMDKSPNT